jgi:predicted MFS family arabinose efflux permease
VLRRIVRVYRDAYSGLPRDLWLLSLITFVNRSGSMVLPFISLYLTQKRGLSVTAAGGIMGLYGVGSGIGSYLGGWLSDRIGPMRTQQLSLVTSGVGFLWLSSLEDSVAIAVAVLLVSVVAEAFRPAVMAAFAQRAPRDAQARGIALLRLAANLGLGVGPAVGGVLAVYSYRWLFVGDAITCWLAALLLALAFSGDEPAGPSRRAARDGRSPWRDGPFLLLNLQIILMGIVIFQAFTTMPLYFRQSYGFREDTIGALMALNALIIVAFEMVLIHRAERHSRMRVIALGALLLCWGFALLPFGSSLYFAAFTVIVWTLGEMLALPLSGAVVVDRSDPVNRGRYMGLYSLSYGIAFLVAPVVGTFVYDRLSAETLWYAIGVLGIPLMIGALALARPLADGTSADRASPPETQQKNDHQNGAPDEIGQDS